MATQILQNEEFKKQSLHNNEILGQLKSVVDSLAAHNKALDSQISLLAETPLGPSPKRHVDVVTTNRKNKSKLLRRVIMRLRRVLERKK